MRVSANGTAIEVDDQGPPSGEPLLLIMGLGMQLISWPEELVQALVAHGCRGVRFDNRDAGLSQGFDEHGEPNLPLAGLRHLLHMPVRSAYTLRDMAADALGVMDALGLSAAHVCGASMGGMVAQHLAREHPARVKSLTLMMTTSGARHLRQPGMKVRVALMSRPDGRDPAAVVAHLTRLMALIGSPAFPADPQRLKQRLAALSQRAWRPAGTARQLAAVVADGDRSSWLPGIAVPTAVIHGDADPLIPPDSGQQLARLIPGATLDLVPGMGHDLPLALLPRFAATIAENAKRERPASV